MAVWSVVNFLDLSEDLRCDAEHYRPEVLALRAAVENVKYPVKSIGEISASVINFGAYSLCNDIVFQEFNERDSDSVEFITAQDIQDGFIDFANARWIPVAQHRALLLKSQVAQHQVLVAMAARLGHAAVYEDSRPLNSSQDIAKITVADPNEVDSYYLATYINSKVGRELLFAAQTGAVQQHTNLGRIKELRVVIPPISTQRKVAALYKQALVVRLQAAQRLSKAEYLIAEILSLASLDVSEKLFYESDFSYLKAANRFGAEYFMPCKQRVLDALASQPGRLLNEHYQSVRELFDATDARRGEQVRNFDLTAALEPVLDDSMETMPAAEIGSTKKKFQAGDVVISRLRSYLREIAVVRTSPAVAAVGSSEFIVLRPRENGKTKLTPETLLIYLRSLPVQTILKWSQDGSAHPRFDENDLLAIPVPDSVVRIAPKINALVNEALTARAEAARLLEAAKVEVERLVLKISPD